LRETQARVDQNPKGAFAHLGKQSTHFAGDQLFDNANYLNQPLNGFKSKKQPQHLFQYNGCRKVQQGFVTLLTIIPELAYAHCQGY